MELALKPLGNIEIHSITFGVLGNGSLQFHVGQKLYMNGKEVVITDIVRDENSYETFKEIPYMVFGNVDGEKKLIKVSVGQPVYLSTKI